jgi:hypothetical protein
MIHYMRLWLLHFTDKYVKLSGTDPQIRTKMSRIHNTIKNIFKHLILFKKNYVSLPQKQPENVSITVT